MTDDRKEEFDPGFRIVDKRKGREAQEQPAAPDAPAQSEAAGDQAPRAAAPGEAAPTAEQGAEAGETPIEPADIHAVVNYCISLLASHAWQSLGLIMNPVTKRTETDLAQARIAIDCTEALLTHIEPHLPPERARDLRRLLSDLQFNFVQRSSRGK